MGKNHTINGIMKISNAGKITCGDNLKINSAGYFNPVGGYRKTALITEQSGHIQIGDGCGISNSLLYCVDKIVLENHVLIGGGCSVCDTDFHPLDYEKRIVHEVEAINHKSILIKEGAFIGMNSIILKGVTIGRHSIVAAGSVVTKDIPDNEIWGGNPAKFIRKIT